MKLARQLFALTVLTAVINFSLLTVYPCGPSYIEPVFEFETSPDIPLQEFAAGNIGLIRSSFGRKALFIAYRYAGGGSFSVTDQAALVEALRGTPPETDDVSEAVRKWLDARKVVAGEEKLPEIYADKNDSGYSFFPNCTKNAFETATQVLNDRIATYGADNPGVREWLKGQDRVFDICSSGSTYPSEVGPESPTWLKKDRAYQIAAAHFYAMDFDEAVNRFEQIADDDESSWKETADYLIGRTLVRKASLGKDEKATREIYDRAETQLEAVTRRSGRYAEAAEQLIGLIRYRSRPQERVHELANELMISGNDNLRQDLIDYTWLLDKFENKVIEEVQKRRREEEQKKNPPQKDGAGEGELSPWEVKQNAVQSGEIISIGFSYNVPSQTSGTWVNLDFKADATDEEILSKFAEASGRKLTEEDVSKIIASKKEALEDRRVYLGANFRFRKQVEKFGHEGDSYGDTELSLELLPAFIRADDLSDWIFTFQLKDDQAFQHATQRWRETGALPWLMAAMSKAKPDSPDLLRVVADAERTSHTTPAYPTIAYHLARLKIAQKKTVEARKLLDEFLASDFGRLPVSTQNSFLELRTSVAANIGEFLKFASRKVVTFDNDGSYGHIRDFLEEEKTWWNAETFRESKEEYVRKTEEEFNELLPWDDRAMFDPHTVDLLDQHFPLDVLAQASLRPELPEYLRESLVLTVWTRAVVLGRHDVAMRFAVEAAKQPAMSEAFAKVINAKTEYDRRNEELWLLVKNPKLSAFVKNGLPIRDENEVSSWEDGWWVEPAGSDYDSENNEVPKDLPKPSFLTDAQSALATKERKQIAALGTGEEYVSRRVLEWAIKAPRDPRVPEALYVVAVINLETKYGDGDTDTRDKAIAILEKKYPNSPWTPKAKEEQY